MPDAGDDPLFPLWVALSHEIYTAEPGESPIERLLTPAWESTCPRVRRAWAILTQPRNLRALELRAKQPMNPTATLATKMALAECRRRVWFLRELA